MPLPSEAIFGPPKTVTPQDRARSMLEAYRGAVSKAIGPENIAAGYAAGDRLVGVSNTVTPMETASTPVVKRQALPQARPVTSTSRPTRAPAAAVQEPLPALPEVPAEYMQDYNRLKAEDSLLDSRHGSLQEDERRKRYGQEKDLRDRAYRQGMERVDPVGADAVNRIARTEMLMDTLGLPKNAAGYAHAEELGGDLFQRSRTGGVPQEEKSLRDKAAAIRDERRSNYARDYSKTVSKD